MVELITLSYNPEDTSDWTNFASIIRESIKQTLKEHKLYRPNLLYRGFSYSNLKKVIKYGQENKNSNQIYVGSEHMEWYDLDNIIQYAWRWRSRGFIAKLAKTLDNFAIAVYAPEFFIDVTPKGLGTLKEGVTFKEVIIAVIVFTPNKN